MAHGSKNVSSTLLPLLLFLIAAIFTTHIQGVECRKLGLAYGDIDPEDLSSIHPSSPIFTTTSFSEATLLAVLSPSSSSCASEVLSAFQSLDASNSHHIQYIPDTAFLITASAELVSALFSNKCIEKLSLVPPHHKISKTLHSIHEALSNQEPSSTSSTLCKDPLQFSFCNDIHLVEDKDTSIMYTELHLSATPQALLDPSFFLLHFADSLGYDCEPVQSLTHMSTFSSYTTVQWRTFCSAPASASSSSSLTFSMTLQVSSLGNTCTLRAPAHLLLTSGTAHTFASHHSILAVHHRPQFRTQNSFSRGIIQTGSTVRTNANNITATPSATPFYLAGLNGDDQILGLGDTGLDYGNCLFWDPNVPNPGPTHRKIISYTSFPATDSADTVAGHGTHVAGTLAGKSSDNSINEAARFDGVAYESKISFVDLGSSSDPSNIYLPSSVQDVYAISYGNGARIHSYSWGSSESLYDQSAMETDTYAFNNPYFLPVFAAGNSGRSGMYTLASPSIAKNTIAVGASQSAKQSYLDQCCATGTCCASYNTILNDPDLLFSTSNMASFSSRGPTLDGRNKPDLAAPGEYIFSSRSDGTGSGLYQCGFAVMRGTSMATPAVAGLAAVARSYFMKGFYPTGIQSAGTQYQPTAALLKAVLMVSANALSGRVDLTGNNVQFANLPTYDLSRWIEGTGAVRLVSALPLSGYIAPADGNTPRQVYVDDNCPTCSALPPPSNSLPVRPLINSIGGISQGQVNRYCFTWTGNGSDVFRASLIWTDRPASVASLNPLVTDLNLVVMDRDLLTTRYGNGDVLNRQEADFLNNAEVVTFSPQPNARLSVAVYGTKIPLGPQPYALAVSGKFIIPSICDAPPCPEGCNSLVGGGTCVASTGACQCNAQFSGLGCGNRDVPLALNATAVTQYTSKPFAFIYHAITVPNTVGTVTIQLNAGDNPVNNQYWTASDPDLYIRVSSRPSLGAYDAREITSARSGSTSVAMPAPSSTADRTVYVGVYGSNPAAGPYTLTVTSFTACPSAASAGQSCACVSSSGTVTLSTCTTSSRCGCSTVPITNAASPSSLLSPFTFIISLFISVLAIASQLL